MEGLFSGAGLHRMENDLHRWIGVLVTSPYYKIPSGILIDAGIFSHVEIFF